MSETVEQFLARGGQIQVIPFGVSGERLEATDTIRGLRWDSAEAACFGVRVI